MYHIAPEAFQRADALTLSPLERSVVFLSRSDNLSSIPDRTGVRAWIARHFGGETPNELAEPKLEALRRFAILLRHHDVPPERDLQVFLRAGYTRTHVKLVSRMIRHAHPARDEGQPSRAQWAILLLFAFGAFAVVQSIAEQIPISVIAGGLTFVTLASLTTPRARHRS